MKILSPVLIPARPTIASVRSRTTPSSWEAPGPLDEDDFCGCGSPIPDVAFGLIWPFLVVDPVIKEESERLSDSRLGSVARTSYPINPQPSGWHSPRACRSATTIRPELAGRATLPEDQRSLHPQPQRQLPCAPTLWTWGGRKTLRSDLHRRMRCDEDIGCQ
jgi:hypothetical protein